jgi:CelD/BcsL family acetyltransferase involved in cellulose biosynthesis
VGSGLHSSLEFWAERHGLSVTRKENRTCPFIELPADFDSLERNFGKQMRRTIRRLQALDAVKIETYSEPGETVARLDTLVTLHKSRWEAAGQHSSLSGLQLQRFLAMLLGRLSGPVSTRLYLLTYEGNAAAALLLFYCGETAFLYQQARDPLSRIAQLSPGTMLIARSVADAINSGFRYYDLLRGDELYKQKWTKQARTTATLLFGRTTRAHAYTTAVRGRESAKALLQRSVPPRMYALLRDVRNFLWLKRG